MAGATQSELARQVRYLKVENEILRIKPPARITVTEKEKNRLAKFAARLGSAINDLVSIAGELIWDRRRIAMQMFLVRTVIAAVIIGVVSEIAHRSPRMALASPEEGVPRCRSIVAFELTTFSSNSRSRRKCSTLTWGCSANCICAHVERSSIQSGSSNNRDRPSMSHRTCATATIDLRTTRTRLTRKPCHGCQEEHTKSSVLSAFCRGVVQLCAARFSTGSSIAGI